MPWPRSSCGGSAGGLPRALQSLAEQGLIVLAQASGNGPAWNRKEGVEELGGPSFAAPKDIPCPSFSSSGPWPSGKAKRSPSFWNLKFYRAKTRLLVTLGARCSPPPCKVAFRSCSFSLSPLGWECGWPWFFPSSYGAVLGVGLPNQKPGEAHGPRELPHHVRHGYRKRSFSAGSHARLAGRHCPT